MANGVMARAPATEADAPAIAALHIRSWQVHSRGLVPDAVLDSLDLDTWIERRRSHLADPIPGSLNWVVEADGGVVGWCVTGPSRGPDHIPDSTELYAMYLDPERVGRGFGRALWLRARAELTGHVALWVLEQNTRARRFYEAAGVRRIDEATGTFHGATSIRMRQDLS